MSDLNSLGASIDKLEDGLTVLIQEHKDLLAALKNMRRHFGNPKRDEWLNDEAFRQAVLADMQAEALIARISQTTGAKP